MQEFLAAEHPKLSIRRKREYLKRFDKIVNFNIDDITEEDLRNALQHLTDNERKTFEAIIRTNYKADIEVLLCILRRPLHYMKLLLYAFD